jgi:hypothetical protein
MFRCLRPPKRSAREHLTVILGTERLINDAYRISALVDPTGAVVAWQRRGEAGLLIADLEPASATRRLALRLREDLAG